MTAAPPRPAGTGVPRVAVAASGGRDSTALLHCTVAQARALGVEVWALHVHHGLVPQADAWLAQVRAQSRRWGARFDARRLSGAPARGESVEAWARRGRYAALAGMAHAAGCPLVLLAHHRRDQAETVLLQALRGGGAAALAAMPRLARRQGLTWARPWLDQPREAIEAYLRRHRLRWADDPGNDGIDFTRSRLRRVLWPALQAAFPQAESGLLHTAVRAADERALLAAMAEADLAAVLGPGAARAGDGGADAGASACACACAYACACACACACAGAEAGAGAGAGASEGSGAAGDPAALPLPPVLALPPPRRRQLLRLWLQRTLPEPPPETLVHRLADELLHAPAGRWPAPGGVLQARRGALHWRDGAALPPGRRQVAP